MYCLDVVEKPFYRDGRMSKEDRMLWTVKLNGRGEPVRARLGADREPVISDPALRIANLSGLDLNVRNVAVLELPASYFGKSEFKPGDRVSLSSDLSTHCQAYQTRWDVTLTLAR